MKKIYNFPKIDAVILAGGKGSRIKNKLNNLPKPMIDISGKPFLDYLINKLCSYPFNKIYIMCGYRSSKIIKKYHKKIFNFVEIYCIVEKKKLGTGGCLKLLDTKISKNFLLLNGDTFFDIDYGFFFKKKNLSKNIISLTLNKNYKYNKKLVCLDIDKKNKIYFNQKSKFINGGVYFFNNKILKQIKKNKKINFSLENDFLKHQIEKKNIYGKKFDSFFIDIGTNKNLTYARKILKKKTSKPAAFLDRDGVINIDRKYVYKISDYEFNPGIIQNLKEISKKYLIFLITNQAGIAHGIFKVKDFFKLHINIKKYLFMKKILFHDVQYCPYHPKAKIKRYKKNSRFRKPGNLMLETIFKRWNIIKNKSFMLGDQKTDEICANKSNLKFFYYKKIINIKNERN